MLPLQLKFQSGTTLNSLSRSLDSTLLLVIRFALFMSTSISIKPLVHADTAEPVNVNARFLNCQCNIVYLCTLLYSSKLPLSTCTEKANRANRVLTTSKHSMLDVGILDINPGGFTYCCIHACSRVVQYDSVGEQENYMLLVPLILHDWAGIKKNCMFTRYTCSE